MDVLLALGLVILLFVILGSGVWSVCRCWRLAWLPCSL
jgi:hypothetical protein